MKSLKLHFESLLDDDDAFYDPENDKKVIENWIKDNYNFSGKLTISDDFVVDCDNYVYVKNRYITSLTNGLFRWGSVGRDFYCSCCENLKSLEGAPKEVNGSFNCSLCNGLVNLEGGPEIVGKDFYCRCCENLKSLEGAPKEINGSFNCIQCVRLGSLEGAPKKVKGDFVCIGCNLTSLEGAPEEIESDFLL